MGLHDALFNPRSGALSKFRSNLIESSMKVLIESIRKGPQIAAQALQNVARYVKEIHQVDQRLKDLMADIISDMKSQINFSALFGLWALCYWLPEPCCCLPGEFADRTVH